MKVKPIVLLLMVWCIVDAIALASTQRRSDSEEPEKEPIKLANATSMVSIPPNDTYVFGGHHFYLPDSNYNIYIKCNGTGQMQPFFDLTDHDPKHAPSAIFFNDNGDSLFANIYERDISDPFTVSGNTQKFAFALADINFICGSSLPFPLFYNNVKIFKTPKTEIQFEHNPTDDNTLSFSFINPQALQEIKQISIMDIDGAKVMDIPLTSLSKNSEIQTVDISDLKNGIYFIQIISPMETKPFKFVIAR